MSYTLMSGVRQNAETPDSFWVPADNERRTLKVGDCVKLMFASDHYEGLTPDHPWVERMWVLITSVDYPRFRGTLDNEPFASDAFGLAAGDEVEFHAMHIINWMTAEEIIAAKAENEGGAR